MPILALESATAAPAVALVEGDAVLALVPVESGAPGSEGLLPAVAAALCEGEVSLADLSGFAVAIGPGSFTGLRVGLATLKGLAFGDPRPVAAVSTLAALVRLAGDPRPEPVVAALDARRGDVYAAVWDAGEAPEPRIAEDVHRLEDLVTRLPERCLWVGDDVNGYPAAAGGGVRPGPAGPCAGHVGILGARLLAAGGGGAAADLVPRYLRRAEAEAKRTGQARERF
ncbi:MAG TPA: tRNA (adenosine(37)-N6)-threonylcarbamoyltransferase complex dimerization subunit type 1 TsaB [Myxococcota bacterium]|nr:tRNA (adenosine(37)-N6)-threonylcarbamoyltransferase complex dimerization subunit type 1 TsaB [Myxococcota bacterium]